MDSPTSKVAGVLGHNVDKYNIVSFPNKENLGDFWTFVNIIEKSAFAGGSEIKDSLFEDTEQPSDTDLANANTIDQINESLIL